jgi:hypothetical protein
MNKGELKVYYQGEPNKWLDRVLGWVLAIFGYHWTGQGYLYGTPDGVLCRSIVHATTDRPRPEVREVTPGGERDLVFSKEYLP